MVEPALVGRLLNDMGPDPDQLPLMQHVLMRPLGDRRARAGDGRRVVLTLDDYEAIGGLATALNNHAEEVYRSRLNRRQQRIAEGLFRCLSEREPGGGRSRAISAGRPGSRRSPTSRAGPWPR